MRAPPPTWRARSSAQPERRGAQHEHVQHVRERPGSRTQAGDPGQTRAGKQGTRPRGARPRAHQRLLLGLLPRALAPRAGPGGRRRSLLPLRPRLHRHGPQHGPAHPAPSRPSARTTRRSWSRPASRRPSASASTCPCPSRSAGRPTRIEKLEAFEFDDPADRAALLRGRRQPDRRCRRRLRAQQPTVGGDGQVAPCRLPRVWQHHRGLRDHHAAARPAQHADLDR